jgi:lipoprotein-releasing system ATP-binding protein
VRNLQRYLGQGEGRVHVLKGVSFEARRGQVYAIVGPSGCGKSTLLYLLGLLDQPDGGDIEINGQRDVEQRRLARTAARGEHIGFVFQFHFLMLEFTALENVMMPMRKLGRLSVPAMEARAHSLLDAVGLGAKTHRLGTQLSGGEQQRVAWPGRWPISRRSSSPTSRPGNLDVKNSALVFDLLTRLAKENGQAVILVTHNPEIAQRCDVTDRCATDCLSEYRVPEVIRDGEGVRAEFRGPLREQKKIIPEILVYKRNVRSLLSTAISGPTQRFSRDHAPIAKGFLCQAGLGARLSAAVSVVPKPCCESPEVAPSERPPVSKTPVVRVEARAVARRADRSNFRPARPITAMSKLFPKSANKLPLQIIVYLGVLVWSPPPESPIT